MAKAEASGDAEFLRATLQRRRRAVEVARIIWNLDRPPDED
jgi:hypothetical protein